MADTEVILNGSRVPYRAVESLFAVGQVFNGNLELEMQVIDPDDLRYRANVKAFYGAGATDFVEFAAGDDKGQYKKFTNLDSAILWLRSAFVDIVDLKIAVPYMEEITKAFQVPTSAESDAIKHKAKFERNLERSNDYLVDLNAQKDSEIAAGWNIEANVHPEVYAIHVETLKRISEVERNNTYYTEQIAHYQAVIDAANA